MQKYDYIIAGTGAAGLMTAFQMANDPFFDSKEILLIDKESKDVNDRTWCFWEKGTGLWDKILTTEWKNIFFASPWFSEQIEIHPYRYKMIRGIDFYSYVLGILDQKSNITRIRENVIGYKDEGSIVEVETSQAFYLGNCLFNSILFDQTYKSQLKYPLLYQHFKGWFIKTKTSKFDADTATFMDFTIAQKGNTRFMYVLPLTETEALFEYTLFSDKILEDKEYEEEITTYLNDHGITSYQIMEKESGCIPMTCYPFAKNNSKNVLHIGTAGGWTKASTGFTFRNTQKKIDVLMVLLKSNKDFTTLNKRTKFWYYDLLFLDVLYQHNEVGSYLFSELFKKNSTTQILKFLNEETSFMEDLKIMFSMPSGKFLKMLVKRLFSIS